MKKNINHIDQSANLINPHLDLDKTKNTSLSFLLVSGTTASAQVKA